MKIRVIQTDLGEFAVQSTFYEDIPFYVDIKTFLTEEKARKFAEDIVNNFHELTEKVIAEYEI